MPVILIEAKLPEIKTPVRLHTDATRDYRRGDLSRLIPRCLGITRARETLRLSNSSRQFAAYVERTRADAVRRHDQASVQMLTPSTYSVTMDFEGGGSPSTQTFSLEDNVTFITSLQTISFDWRGRIPSCE